MRHLLCLLPLAMSALGAREYALTVVDEADRPLAGVGVTALFGRANDPRLSSMRTLEGKTDGAGLWRFQADEDMYLERLRAAKPGHFEADMTEVHGLGKIPSDPTYRLTLPRETAEIPLCYKEVRLGLPDGNLPRKTWIGFDLGIGDLVTPHGKGQVADLRFWFDGEQVGWTETDETIERFRKDKDLARISDALFRATFGSFRGVTRVSCDEAGDGIRRSPSFWPYCELKMPPLAPTEGYAKTLEIPFATLPLPSERDAHVGYYLRVRTRLGPDGQVVSAHYAKIQGPIRGGYGWVAFRYYYNPTADDRRLVLDRGRNLLRPPAGTEGDELIRYRPYER